LNTNETAVCSRYNAQGSVTKACRLSSHQTGLPLSALKGRNQGLEQQTGSKKQVRWKCFKKPPPESFQAKELKKKMGVSGKAGQKHKGEPWAGFGLLQARGASWSELTTHKTMTAKTG